MPHFNDTVYHRGGMPAGGPITGGDTFWVDSGASLAADTSSNGGSRDKPFATLAYAFSSDRPTASNGDQIIVCEGHAETVAGAAGIAQDIAGVRVIGLGEGALRPTFTFSATDSTWTVSAASSSIENILIKPSIDSVVSPIVVSAADVNLDIEVQDASASVECVRAVLTTAAADRLTAKIKYIGFITGNACVNVIRLVGCNTGKIDIDAYGEFSTAVVEFHTTECYDIQVGGYFYNDNVALTKNVVDTKGSGTWFVDGYDGKGGYHFSGGSAATVAADDVGTVSSAVSTVTSFATTSSTAVSGLTSSAAISSTAVSTVTSFATTSSTAVSGLTSSAAISSTAVSGLTSSAAVSSTAVSTVTSFATTSSAAVSGLTSSLTVVSTTLSEMMSHIVSGW